MGPILSLPHLDVAVIVFRWQRDMKWQGSLRRYRGKSVVVVVVVVWWQQDKKWQGSLRRYRGKSVVIWWQQDEYDGKSEKM